MWIARQTADGLDALYEAAGVIHTDVKPANILVSPTGHATLIDFGFVQTPAEASHWATRPLAGTLAYIAPEMVTSTSRRRTAQRHLQPRRHAVRNAHRPAARGKPMTRASSPCCIAKPSRPTCAMLRPETPDAVADLIHSMLAKDPLRRPASARELSAKLVRLEIKSFTLL